MSAVLDDQSISSAPAPIRDRRLRSERIAAQGIVLRDGEWHLRALGAKILRPATGLALLLMAWQAAAAGSDSVPAPVTACQAALRLMMS